MFSISGNEISVPAQGVAGDTVATQNLFEHVMANSRENISAVTPPELIGNVMDNLGGFLERYQNFSTRDVSSTIQGGEGEAIVIDSGKDEKSSSAMDDDKYDKVIESLSTAFNHAIETGLVVRGCTQISGACNTLLRGQ